MAFIHSSCDEYVFPFNNLLLRSAALLFTFSPPGNIPVVWQPRYVHSLITCQIFKTPSFVSFSLRHVFSFSITTSCMDSPVFKHQCKRFAEVVTGNGSKMLLVLFASPSFTTKPPPIE